MRYQLKSEIRDIDGVRVLDGLVFKTSYYTGEEIYYQVTSGEENRLDIISYKVYKSPIYWWVIALHNKIKDPIFEITAGMYLTIPTDLKKALESIGPYV